MTDFPLTGGCQCGALRYEVASEPLGFAACHCTECQRQSMSAHGLSLYVDAAVFTLIKGTPQIWSRVAALSGKMDCAFCSTCGARVFHRIPGDSVISVKAGGIDNLQELQPVAHIWLHSARAFTALPPDVLRYDEEPEDFTEIFEAWRTRRGGATRQ
ncbi:MAG: GFA family protein [Rhodobacteraceae bacterium]|nr:GFA family protein [Paracoccaceae bacterium]